MEARSDAAVRKDFGEQTPKVWPGSIDMNRFAWLALTVCVMAPPTALHGPHRGAQFAPVDTLAPGLEVLREVHRRYSATRFRTLTFVQKTTFPDGRVEWWYEAESIPGKARVDVAPFANRNAQIFRNDSAYVFQLTSVMASEVRQLELPPSPMATSGSCLSWSTMMDFQTSGPAPSRAKYIVGCSV